MINTNSSATTTAAFVVVGIMFAIEAVLNVINIVSDKALVIFAVIYMVAIGVGIDVNFDMCAFAFELGLVLGLRL